KRAGEEVMKKNGFAQINGVAVAAFLLCLVIGAWVGTAMHRPAPPVILLALPGLYMLFAIKIVQQWQKVALLRLGRYVGLRGPGLFFIIPVIETMSDYVDQRVRVASVTAESALSKDTVPVNVDAIVFWLVWNAEKAILEVEKLMCCASCGLF